MIAAQAPYTVQNGDTLSEIAYSHHVSLASVEAANPQIHNPDVIYPGQRVALSGRAHTVAKGETLGSIAAQNGVSLAALIKANPQITNPDVIYPGEAVALAGHGSYTPRHTKVAAYTPRHAKPKAPVTSAASPANLGHYSVSGLKALWVAAGGPAGSAAVAACIAGFESGGNPSATGAAGERGLWQIMPGWGSLSTYSPSGNAAGAVSISKHGTDWSPWSTHAKCGV